jgi:hypothetical protein
MLSTRKNKLKKKKKNSKRERSNSNNGRKKEYKMDANSLYWSIGYQNETKRSKK